MVYVSLWSLFLKRAVLLKCETLLNVRGSVSKNGHLYFKEGEENRKGKKGNAFRKQRIISLNGQNWNKIHKKKNIRIKWDKEIENEPRSHLFQEILLFNFNITGAFEYK